MDGRELLIGMSFVHAKYVQEAERMVSSEKNVKNRFGRTTRFLLIAALISTLMATTVLAYVGFIRYENPMELLKTFFGADAYSVEEGEIRTETYYGKEYHYMEPAIEHVPVDEDAAQEVAPYISAVGQSISYEDYTLTIEAHQYDSATDCGIIYYTVENQNGISGYKIQPWGELWWPDGELVNLEGASWMNYIIQEESSETKLAVAAYYCGADTQSNIIGLMFFRESGNTLKLQLNDGGGMKYKAYEDAIAVSPIAIRIHLQDFKFLGYTFVEGKYLAPVDDANLEYLALRFEDGTEYVVKTNTETIIVDNTKYALINENTDAFYVFNRLVDIENLKAIVINRNEYPVD